MLVVLSTIKFTLSLVYDQAFLSQSTCLLTNISTCESTFLFFSSNIHAHSKLMISTHASPFHAINSQHQFHNKNNYVCTAYSDNQVKLFSMLQDMHTTIHNQKYVIININLYHKKDKCTKSIVIIIFIKKKTRTGI